MPLKRISVYFSNGSSVNLRTLFQVILHEGFDSVFKPSFKSVHLTTPLQQSTCEPNHASAAVHTSALDLVP